MTLPDYVHDKTRLAVLDNFAILDTSPEQGFDDIVSLACLICDTPVALVSLVSGTRQWFKAKVGFEPCETDLDSSVCAYVLVERDILIIPDLTEDPRTDKNPLVTGEPHIRFYAGAPLRDEAGNAIGSLCVIDNKPRPEGLNAQQAEGLRNLARQVMTQLELKHAIHARNEAIKLRNDHDIQRRASDTQYRMLFEAIEDGFCIVELKFDGERPVDYRFIEINPAFASQTGLTDAHGKWMRDLAPNHEEHWFEIYGRVAQTGEPTRFEHYAKELDGRWFDVHAFRVGEPTDKRVGILFADSTERKNAARLKKSAEDAQMLLNQELNHRMKNMFAMIQAIATQTLRPITQREPVDAFTKRLHALSTAHNVLLQQNWTEAKLLDVVSSVMGTFTDSARFQLEGPTVNLGPSATLSLSLILHELATNALKYGALSVPEGSVSASWDVVTLIEGSENLVFSWRELNGPPAIEPTRKGFGTKLINMGLVGTGGVRLSYEHSGFSAEFKAPLLQVQAS
ncbi:sensor histidine kinase [Agrobacterium sp. V1]|uniref:sensor histidine kinase n=1 Tax=Agrobacterium sp. V1 TaxID=3061957 RepID=UPI002672EE2D|nr:HWE histidine kinase domain-containing protein [Agrobacterium sp. V1]MDO3441375.1 HWE histidine kinase domain-containing protein [Agrobacterium sp. V1]